MMTVMNVCISPPVPHCFSHIFLLLISLCQLIFPLFLLSLNNFDLSCKAGLNCHPLAPLLPAWHRKCSCVIAHLVFTALFCNILWVYFLLFPLNCGALKDRARVLLVFSLTPQRGHSVNAHWTHGILKLENNLFWNVEHQSTLDAGHHKEWTITV